MKVRDEGLPWQRDLERDLIRRVSPIHHFARHIGRRETEGDVTSHV